jgi:hypothetical protein
MLALNTNSSRGPDAVTGRRHAIPATLQAVALVVLFAAASGARAESDARSVSESRPASSEGRVHIETLSGTLAVSGWSEDKVEVTGTLDRRATLTVETSGDLVTVKVEWPRKGMHGFHNCVSDLQVRVPARSALAIQVVSAETSISGVSGALEVESVSGNVNISGDSKRIEAKAVSGEIEVTAGAGRVSAEAVSGEVTIQAAGGEVDGSTVSGRVTLRGGPFERVSLEAVSGDTEFDGELTPDARVDISNHSGAVDFRLQGTPSGEFEVSTFSGDIKSELGGEAHRSSKWAPGEEYNQTIGSGGPRISIEAFSGTVRLRKSGS